MTLLLVCLAVIAGAVAASTACGVNMIFTVRISLDRAPAHRVLLPYVAGSVLGATVVGAALGIAGTMFRIGRGADALWPEWTIAVLLVAAMALGLRELGLIHFRLPQRESQLNSDGLLLGISRRLFWFGAWLGAAFFTYSPYGGLYVLALAAIIAPSFELAVLLFIAFGLSRGLTVAILGSISKTWEDTARVSDRIAAAYPVAKLLSAGSLGGAAIVAAALLVL